MLLLAVPAAEGGDRWDNTMRGMLSVATRAKPSGIAASPCHGLVRYGSAYSAEMLLMSRRPQARLMSGGPRRAQSRIRAPGSMRYSSDFARHSHLAFKPSEPYSGARLTRCRVAASLASELAPHDFLLGRAGRSAGLLKRGPTWVRPVRTRPYSRAPSFWRRPCARQCR